MHLEKMNALSAEDPLPRGAPCAPASRPGGEAADLRRAMVWRILTAFTRLTWKRSILLWIRFAANPPLSLAWWRWLTRFAASHGYPLPHDDLMQKPLTKFLVHRLKGWQRLGLLTGHFSIAATILSRDTMVRLWQGERLSMGEVRGRSGAYECLLMLADQCGGRHEGAFAIRLVRSLDGATLCKARFTFVHEDAGQVFTFVVGSLQGVRNARQTIVDATRDLHGLRPKEAVLLVLQGLAAEGRARHFYAVSSARHPIRYRRPKRQFMLLTDVDGFWLERSGEPDDAYGFVVPCSRIGGRDKRNASKARFMALGEAFR